MRIKVVKYVDFKFAGSFTGFVWIVLIKVNFETRVLIIPY